MDWNFAISETSSSNTPRVERLRSSGALICDHALLRLPEPPNTSSNDAREQQTLASRFIENCHNLYFQSQVQANSQSSIDTRSLSGFPLFWTHAHSTSNSALTTLQRQPSINSNLPQEDNATLDKALTLVLKLDPYQKLCNALRSLRSASIP